MLPRGDSALVLDLDEALISAQFDQEDLVRELKKDPDISDAIHRIGMIDKDGSGEIRYTWVITRPHLEEFLRGAAEEFDHLIVWTAGIYSYAHAVVRAIWPKDEELDPLWIFSRDDIKEAGNRGKPHEYILERFPYIDPERIVGVDDKDYNFEENPRKGIRVPEYRAQPTVESIAAGDTVLLDLLDFFQSPEFHQTRRIQDLDLNLFDFNDDSDSDDGRSDDGEDENSEE